MLGKYTNPMDPIKTKNFRYLKWRYQVPYVRLFWGVGGTPLHKPYVHTAYIGEDSSILGTTEMFGDSTIEKKSGQVQGGPGPPIVINGVMGPLEMVL